MIGPMSASTWLGRGALSRMMTDVRLRRCTPGPKSTQGGRRSSCENGHCRMLLNFVPIFCHYAYWQASGSRIGLPNTQRRPTRP